MEVEKPSGGAAAAVEKTDLLDHQLHNTRHHRRLWRSFDHAPLLHPPRQEDLVFQLAGNRVMACNPHSPHRLIHAPPQGQPRGEAHPHEAPPVRGGARHRNPNRLRRLPVRVRRG
ncbi:UNVERIFIED_CONTAM: hypothetical protein Slati_3356100 [Sesamum latifolium]|uniref:Uncharacterized protein n=1 Tax=Sesamum latifolium TaxID=2727402 RepID=A0AAW2UE88_9LAMI